MGSTIRRNLALKEIDAKETPDGKQRVFSIKFIKQDGELVYFQHAVASGLKADMKANRLKAVVPVDEKGDAVGHVYPVHIDFIVELNGLRVVL